MVKESIYRRKTRTKCENNIYHLILRSGKIAARGQKSSYENEIEFYLLLLLSQSCKFNIPFAHLYTNVTLSSLPYRTIPFPVNFPFQISCRIFNQFCQKHWQTTKLRSWSKSNILVWNFYSCRCAKMEKNVLNAFPML